jgi:hypothetical protein
VSPAVAGLRGPTGWLPAYRGMASFVAAPPCVKAAGRKWSTTIAPKDSQARQNLWRHRCGCKFQRPEYPASDSEIVSMQALLAERGLPASDRFAQSVLTALADSRTRCVFEGMADRDVEITYNDVRRRLGHDLSLIGESSPPDRRQ